MALAAGGLSLQSATPSEAALTQFTLHLIGANEVPPVSGGGSATVTLSFNDQTNELHYGLTVQGVASSDVTAAHIHLGAIGKSGPVVYTLAGPNIDVASGTITLTADDLSNLKKGLFYVNVHSKEHPSGFARAQLALDPTDQIKNQISSLINAWNQQDVEDFLQGWTDNGLQSSFGVSSRDEARQQLPQFMQQPLAVTINDVTVTGATNATSNMLLSLGNYVETHADTWTLVNGEWRIDNETILPTPIPAGVRSVDLQLKEYAFVYDKAQIADGNFAFSITNVGTMNHEVGLAKIPADMTVNQLLQAFMQGGPDSPPPPGVEDYADVGPFSPGEHGTLVFTKPLPAGHYVLLCFEPDANGTPHAFLGMTSEFTVGGSSGANITPPNTGDAGLKATSGASYSVDLILGALIALTGLASLGVMRRSS